MENDFLIQGKLKAQQNDLQGAIADFSQALQIESYNPEIYYQRGLAYFDLGKTLPSITDYNKAIEIDPEYAEAYYARSLAKISVDNLTNSLKDIDKAISLNPKYAPAYQLKGIIKRKMGEIQTAIVNFKQAANLYLDEKDAESCRRCLDLIKQIEIPQNIPTIKNKNISSTQNVTTTSFHNSSPPPSPILKTEDYYHKILNKAEMGNFQSALDELNYLLQVDAQDLYAYRCRGIILRKRGDFQSAMADFNQALRINPQDEISLRNRGKIRAKLGDFGGAISDFNQALRFQPHDSLLLVARGEAYNSMGDFQRAIADFTEALRINPNQTSAYVNRGNAYLKIEEMQNAILDYQKAVSLFLEKEDWQNYQATLDLLKKIQYRHPNNYLNSLNPKKSSENPLRQRLLILVGGYDEIAERLLNQVKEYYPGMSEEWYLEKVIYDIEHDRR